MTRVMLYIYSFLILIVQLDSAHAFSVEMPTSSGSSIVVSIESDGVYIFENMSAFTTSDIRNIDSIRPKTDESHVRVNLQNAFSNIVQEFGYDRIEPYILSSIGSILLELADRDSVFRKKYANSEIFNIPNLSDERINILFFGERVRFDDFIRERFGVSSATAYFDARSNTIALYINTHILRHFGYQSNWSGYSEAYFISELKNYINQIMMLNTSHEVMHFAQNLTSSPYYRYTPIKEGLASTLSIELVSRDDIQNLAFSMARFPGRSTAISDKCEDPPKLRIFEPYEHNHYLRVASTIGRVDKFSITRWFFENSTEEHFHKSNQEKNYSLSLVFTKFLLSIRGVIFDDFERMVLTFEASGNIDDIDSEVMDRFDAYFASEILRETYFTYDEDSLENHYQNAMASVTFCLISHPMNAYIWALQALAVKREANPEVLLYIGDIFFNAGAPHSVSGNTVSGHPLLALRFYRSALLRFREKHGVSKNPFCPKPPEFHKIGEDELNYLFMNLRMHSRLGETYTAIGSIDSSIRYLECVISYSNDIHDAGFHIANFYFASSLIPADMELLTNYRTRDAELQFSRERYETLAEAKANFKSFVRESVGSDIRKIEPLQLCLFYMIQATVLTFDLGGQEEASSEGNISRDWEPRLKFCGGTVYKGFEND